MDCKYCQEYNYIKKSIRNYKLRYYFNDYKKSFQETKEYNAYTQTTNYLICNLLKKSGSIKEISRVIGISSKTVLSRMLLLSKQIKIPRLADWVANSRLMKCGVL